VSCRRHFCFAFCVLRFLAFKGGVRGAVVVSPLSLLSLTHNTHARATPTTPPSQTTTTAEEIFMSQPNLLELEAPIKICGASYVFFSFPRGALRALPLPLAAAAAAAAFSFVGALRSLDALESAPSL
jgi:hypothetical protein